MIHDYEGSHWQSRVSSGGPVWRRLEFLLPHSLRQPYLTTRDNTTPVIMSEE